MYEKNAKSEWELFLGDDNTKNIVFSEFQSLKKMQIF